MTAAIKNVHPIRWIQMENRRFREFIAEFIGTFFFVFIGVSANIQAAMQPNPVSLLTAQFAWGFGLMFGIYLAINVSGGHCNPAISFSALLFGKIGILQFIIYTIAQLLGAFAGTGIAFVGHLDDMGQLTQHWTRRETIGPNATAGLFATFPTTHMTVLGSIADELLGTAILAGMIAVCTDKRREIHQSHVPLLIGLTLITIAMTFGLNGGFAVNPARDFGPRLFLLCVGYGWRLFSVHKYFFLIPLIVPFFGAPLGTAIYELFVGIHGWNEQIDVVNEQYPQREHKGHGVSGFPTGSSPDLVAISHQRNSNGGGPQYVSVGVQRLPSTQQQHDGQPYQYSRLNRPY